MDAGRRQQARHRLLAVEAVVPYEAFRSAGHTVTAATPGAVVPPADPAGLGAGTNGGEESAARIKAAVEGAEEFRTPVAPADVRVTDFDAVYVPGGHGPMEDLVVDADSGRVPTRAVESGLPVGAVCQARPRCRPP